MKRLDASPGLIAAASCLLIATTVLGAAVHRAILPPASPAVDWPPEAAKAPARESGITEEALLLAAEHDPFSPARGVRPDTTSALGQVEANALPEVTVLGTVVLAEDRGLAMLRTDGAPPRLVRTGQQFQTMTLVRVEPGRALLRMPDGSPLAVPVRKD